MADQKTVRFHDGELPHNPNRSGGRPRPRSPFPRPSTDEWRTKTILSIDGGGIRGCGALLTLRGFVEGYRSLVVLRALMEDIGKVERACDPKAVSSFCSSALGPLDYGEMSVAEGPDEGSVFRGWPCHYFEYVAGVGTGGVVAVMLGRCRMTVGDAIATYRELCTDITLAGQQLGYSNPLLSARDPASKCLKAHFRNLLPAWPSPHEDGRFLKSDPERCHTVVCGCGPGLDTLRSDDPVSNPPLSIKHVVSQCFSAAEPPSRESYCAARHYYANPSRTVLAEVSRTLKGKRDSALLLDDDEDYTVQSPEEEDGAWGDEDDVVIDLLSVGAAIDDVSATPHPDKPADDSVAAFLHAQRARQVRTVHNDLEAQTLRFDARRFVLRHYNRLDDASPLFAAAAADDDSSSSSSSSLQDNNIGAKDRKPKDNTLSALDRIDQRAASLFGKDGHGAAELRRLATCLVRKRRRRAQTEGWERWVGGSREGSGG